MRPAHDLIADTSPTLEGITREAEQTPLAKHNGNHGNPADN